MSILDNVLIAEAARLDALPADLRVVELVKLSASLPVMASISDRLEKGEDVGQDEIDALAKGRGGKLVNDFVAYLGQTGRRMASGIRATPDKLPKTARAVGTVVAGAAALSACGPGGCAAKPKRGMTDVEVKDIIRRMRRDLISEHGRKAVREMDREGRAQIQAEDAAQVKDGLLTQAQFDAKWPKANRKVIETAIAGAPRVKNNRHENPLGALRDDGFKVSNTMRGGTDPATGKTRKDGRAGRDADGDGKRDE